LRGWIRRATAPRRRLQPDRFCAQQIRAIGGGPSSLLDQIRARGAGGGGRRERFCAQQIRARAGSPSAARAMLFADDFCAQQVARGAPTGHFVRVAISARGPFLPVELCAQQNRAPEAW
jgi:hypothetical protein